MPASSLDRAELEKRLRTEQKKLALVQEISRALSSALELDHLLALIMEKVTLLMEADRSTLYLLSDDRRTLWSKVLSGGSFEEIRLGVGEGIAGWVAASGETLNIADAYTDSRFQPRVDSESGYRTRSILCAPMRDSTGEIIGVLQLLNKKGGPFTTEDEELLTALSSQAAVSIENSKLYHSVVAKNVELIEAQEKLQQRTGELNVLYEIEREMNEARDLDELLHRLLHRAMAMVRARSGSICLSEGDGELLRFRTCAGPAAERLLGLTLPAGRGIIGWTVQNGTATRTNDPAADPRHDGNFASEMTTAPQSLLCAPLVGSDGVFGAIELIDKDASDSDDVAGFGEADQRLLTLVAGQVSRSIQVARAKQEQEEQDRLAAIGQMLAGVVHDLKTPMTIISGYAQLMAQLEDAAQREQYVDQILRQFDLMSGMTRSVLAFARGESNVLVRKVYLHRFLEQITTQLRHAFAGRHIELELDARYTGVAYFDEQAMLRLVHNLARNAADAMKGRGRFRVITFVDGDWICFQFADDGPGIPAELEGRLFELFSTATEGGTGLGLAICKKIVDQHGGSISYDTAPGQGTTFTVRLPKERPEDMPNTGEWQALPSS